MYRLAKAIRKTSGQWPVRPKAIIIACLCANTSTAKKTQHLDEFGLLDTIDVHMSVYVEMCSRNTHKIVYSTYCHNFFGTKKNPINRVGHVVDTISCLSLCACVLVLLFAGSIQKLPKYGAVYTYDHKHEAKLVTNVSLTRILLFNTTQQYYCAQWRK